MTLKQRNHVNELRNLLLGAHRYNYTYAWRPKYVYMSMYVCIYLTPPQWTLCDIRSILNKIKPVWIHISPSIPVASRRLKKTKEKAALLIKKWIHAFPIGSKTKTASSRVWSGITDFISKTITITLSAPFIKVYMHIRVAYMHVYAFGVNAYIRLSVGRDNV